MREKILNVAVVAVVLSAVLTTALTVRRELFSSVRASAPEVSYEPDWLSYATAGQVIGPPEAPLTIIEFADFQCPACRAFKADVEELRRRYPNDVRLIYRHFPLSTHPVAVPAARASECAAEQGKFKAMHDALYEDQASIGVVPWSSFAQAAGLPDLRRFEACISRSEPFQALEKDIAAGNRLGISGTPTVLVNGWRPQGNPGLEWLAAQVEQARNAAVRR